MTFPALVPSARVFTTGNLPQTNQVSLSGVNTGFRQGNLRTEQTLALTYTNLNETDLNLIKDHFIDRKGTFDIFFLSSEVWSGYVFPPTGLVDVYAWRYAEAPRISDGIVGRWTVEVNLVSHITVRAELVIDGLSASAADSRAYIVDGGSASATPERTYVITSGLAA